MRLLHLGGQQSVTVAKDLSFLGGSANLSRCQRDEKLLGRGWSIFVRAQVRRCRYQLLLGRGGQHGFHSYFSSNRQPYLFTKAIIMTKTVATVLFLCFGASTALAGTIRVYNNDSKEHTIKLKCSGSSKTVKVKASTTASYTFHSSSKECDIVGGSVKFPTKKLIDGQKWKFKNDKAVKN